jgi:hypothetical protein
MTDAEQAEDIIASALAVARGGPALRDGRFRRPNTGAHHRMGWKGCSEMSRPACVEALGHSIMALA